MIQLHVYYSDELKHVSMKTRWAEITYLEYCRLLSNELITNDDVLKYQSNIATLTGLTIGEVKQFDNSIQLSLLPYLKFLETNTGLIQIKQIDISIGAKPWGLLELAKQKLKHANNYEVALSLIDIIKVYTSEYNDELEPISEGVDISNMLLSQALPYAKHFEKELSDFYIRYKKLGEYKPTAEEVMAGIDSMDVFGFMNTLDALAGGDILKHQDILKLPADYVFTKLLKDFEKSKFTQKHHELISKRK